MPVLFNFNKETLRSQTPVQDIGDQSAFLNVHIYWSATCTNVPNNL